MKLFLLTITFVLTFVSTQAQNLLSQNFNVVPVPGWTESNQSTLIGTAPLWFQGNPDSFPSYAGNPNSYIGVNYNSTLNLNTISNWLFTPVVGLQNGDVITFYSRTTFTTNTPFPDRLEMRIGSSTAAAPVGATGVGGYTTLAISINPNLTTTGYPNAWTQYTYTVSGLTGPTNNKIAFRYFVTSGGPDGTNSDYIGIDSFSIDRPLSTEDFFASNFLIFPNPVKDIFNVTTKNGSTIESINIIDINGRVVNSTNAGSSTIQVNISQLNSGVYFLKVQSELGVGTSRIIKN